MKNSITKPNPITGNFVESESEADAILAQVEHLRNEVKPLCERDEDSWLPEWFMKKVTQNEAMIDQVKKQSRRIVRQLQSELSALQYRFGDTFKDMITDRILAKHGEKKSVDLMSGRAGYRKKPATIYVTDEKALVEWFNAQSVETRNQIQDCFDLRFARKTPILKYVRETGNLPDGVEFLDERDEFYPQLYVPQLPELKTTED